MTKKLYELTDEHRAQHRRIRECLEEYNIAQRDQIRACSEANEAAVVAHNCGVVGILRKKATSARADGDREFAIARVFDAAADLVSALDAAGFGEAP